MFLRNALLAAAIIAPTLSFGGPIMIGKSDLPMEEIKISAQGVKGINVRPVKTVVRHDCNKISLGIDLKNVAGNDDVGYWRTDFVVTSMGATELFCPLEKPITETIHSNTVFVPSLQNRNANGKIEMTLIVPKGEELEITEAK